MKENTASKIQTGKITLETLCDLMEESKIETTLDMGCTTLHKVLHPMYGAILLVNNSQGENAVMDISSIA